MRDSKHGLKALNLAIMAAVLGTMAFAASAQAQTHEEKLHTEALHTEALHKEALENNVLPLSSTPGSITINGGAFLLATATGEQVGSGSLLVPGRNLKLECSTGHVTEGKINSATEALGKVEFLSCLSLALSDGKHLPCVTVGLGTITAFTVLLPILHGPASEEKRFVLAEPEPLTEEEKKEGKVARFTTVEYKEGTECPLPLNNPVTGSISAEVDKLEGESLTLTFSPEIQLLTGDVLRYGGFPSYIHASATVKLTGAHEKQELGIH